MALETVDVRMKIPEDLDVILEALADDAGVAKSTYASEIVIAMLQKELKKFQRIHSGLKGMGLQGQVEERRVLSGKQ
jgi:predicted RNA-binding protein with PUA domain